MWWQNISPPLLVVIRYHIKLEEHVSLYLEVHAYVYLRLLLTNVYKEIIEFLRHSTQWSSPSYSWGRQSRIVVDLGSTWMPSCKYFDKIFRPIHCFLKLFVRGVDHRILREHMAWAHGTPMNSNDEVNSSSNEKIWISSAKFAEKNETLWILCGKFITWPHKWKLPHELPFMLQRIQRDICGPINPPCGPFRHCLAFIDASTKWSHVSHLANRNLAFHRLLIQII